MPMEEVWGLTRCVRSGPEPRLGLRAIPINRSRSIATTKSLLRVQPDRIQPQPMIGDWALNQDFLPDPGASGGSVAVATRFVPSLHRQVPCLLKRAFCRPGRRDRSAAAETRYRAG